MVRSSSAPFQQNHIIPTHSPAFALPSRRQNNTLAYTYTHALGCTHRRRTKQYKKKTNKSWHFEKCEWILKNKHERRTCTLYKRDTVAAAATYIIYIYKVWYQHNESGRGFFFIIIFFFRFFFFWFSCWGDKQMDGVGWYKMEGGCTERMDTGE